VTHDRAIQIFDGDQCAQWGAEPVFIIGIYRHKETPITIEGARLGAGRIRRFETEVPAAELSERTEGEQK
jgi:hypothetical protein